MENYGHDNMENLSNNTSESCSLEEENKNFLRKIDKNVFLNKIRMQETITVPKSVDY